MNRVKIDLEFIFRASPGILYSFFTEPAKIVRWFCDEVDITGNVFTFIWSGSEEIARLVGNEDEEKLRFKWEESENDEEYLEIRFSQAPVTNETILEITDFCDEDEKEDQKILWTSQMEKLRHETGG
jgi:uncharacterized protein YndB with AHSA1/START domain